MNALGASIGLPELAAGALVLALNAYLLTGGADFGGGVWDLLATGPRRDAQRALIAAQIGPIWEANHVWLILAVVVLFTAFPPAFATLGTVLHVPLSLMLVGIVLRGSSFVFRSYGARDGASQRRWSRVFAAASIVTPVLLGIVVGAIASGAVGEAAAALASAGPPPAGLSATSTQSAGARLDFWTVYMHPWLAPFPLAMGVLALAMFAFLAATYLAVAAREEALREDFRRRALAAAAVVLAAALAGLPLAHRHAPAMSRALTTGWLLALLAATGLAALLAVVALSGRRWRLARIAAGAEVSLILWGWAGAQYPLLVPPSESVSMAAAPRATLALLLYALAGGGAILFPALAYLFRLFSRRAEP